ncbi:MAG: hypothetical protein Q7R30_06410 [Acidobacteriota bacterium]|nr:hypothetical protein [Acidobacteriota bacterium]
MGIRTITLAVSAIAIAATASFGLGVFAQSKPVSARTGVVVYKSPT